MYSLTNACFNFSCPNLFANCFNDITTSKSINSKKQEELEEWMKKALKNNPGFKTVVQGKAESLQNVSKNKQNLTGNIHERSLHLYHWRRNGRYKPLTCYVTHA
jgi:hypothetical protein